MEDSTPFSNIPNEIIPLILLQLPMKAVIRFQCVCKQWRSWIDGSDFKLSYRGHRRVIILSRESWNDSTVFVGSTSRDLHLQRHKWPFGEACGGVRYYVRVLCSCNGVVLLFARGDILLWNPSTRCTTEVLKWPYWVMKTRESLAGLCYDSYTRDYKVVLLYHHFDDPFVIYASLNHKEWLPVQFPYNSARGGIEFRNTFHWWENSKMQVLIMKEYGRQESWIAAFAIQMPGLGYIYGSYCLTFYSQKKNAQDVLFLSRNVDWYGRKIYVYDRKKNKLKRDRVYFPPCRRYFGSMCFYVESFACPDRPQWRGDDDKPNTNT
nr:F-box/kelch-repeat protein At3g23880-like [Ipomoea batatas]